LVYSINQTGTWAVAKGSLSNVNIWGSFHFSRNVENHSTVS